MKWKFNLPKSPDLLYYLWKLTGLAPFTMKNNRFYPPTLLDKLYPVFIAASYLLFVTITFTPIAQSSYTAGYSPFMHTWSTIIHLLSLPSIILTLIIFLFMYQKIIYLMDKMCIVTHELKSLGTEESHGIFFKNVWKSTVMANAALIAACVIIILMETQWHIFLSIKYCIDNWFALNTVLIFVYTLICIRRYFILVNEKLYDLLIPAPHLRLSDNPRIFVVNRRVNEEDQSESEGPTDLKRIQKIEALHLELCDLVDRTTRLFAIPIVLNILRLATQFMLSSYYLYFVFQNSSYSGIGSILCTVLRMVVTIGLLFIIAYASAITCEEGNATRAVLFKAWVKFRPAKLTNEFIMFSAQLLHTPVAVSAFGFMDFNYSFVFRILSIVVTYLIVMIQLGT